MADFEFNGLSDDTHECTSHREGEWMIFRCPHCPGYERRFNWVTGEMQVRRGDSVARHTCISTKSRNMDALLHLGSEN